MFRKITLVIGLLSILMLAMIGTASAKPIKTSPIVWTDQVGITSDFGAAVFSQSVRSTKLKIVLKGMAPNYEFSPIWLKNGNSPMEGQTEATSKNGAVTFQVEFMGNLVGWNFNLGLVDYLGRPASDGCSLIGRPIWAEQIPLGINDCTFWLSPNFG